jgi:hypothetical protein
MEGACGTALSVMCYRIRVFCGAGGALEFICYGGRLGGKARGELGLFRQRVLGDLLWQPCIDPVAAHRELPIPSGIHAAGVRHPDLSDRMAGKEKPPPPENRSALGFLPALTCSGILHRE